MQCECGCGLETSIAPENDSSKGWVKGQPLRFVRYHNRRVYSKYDYTSDSPEYSAWWSMKQRCQNPDYEGYSSYGARGIKISDDMLSFDGFMSVMGPRPGSKYSIDRIDNNGNYERGNVRWATHSQQMRNNRRKLSLAKAEKIKNLSSEKSTKELADIFKVSARTIRQIITGETWNGDNRTAAAISY